MNNKLLKLLGKLPETELRAFTKYMHTVHKKDEQLPKLLSIIKKFHPNFAKSNMTAAHVFTELYGQKKFNGKLLSTQFSKLEAEFDKYIYLKSGTKQSLEYNFILLKYFKDFGIVNRVKTQIKTISGILDEQRTKDLDSWMYSLRMLNEHYYYLETEKYDQLSGVLRKALNQLIYFCEGGILKYACEVYSRTDLVAERMEETDLAMDQVRLLERLEKKDFQNWPYFHQCYQLALRMIKTRDPKIFEELKLVFFENINEFGKDDLHILFTYLLNNTSYYIRKGEKGYLAKSLELYKFAVKNDLLLSEGYFNPDHFSNIVDVACQLKDFVWLENLLPGVYQQLNPSIRMDQITHAKALLAFSQDDFEACKKILKEVDGSNPVLALRMKWLDLAARYETKENDEYLLKLCQDIEKYTKKHRVFGEKYKASVLLSIRIVRKLVQNKYKNIEKLREEFLQSKNYYKQSWIEKILEIKK